MKHIYIDMLIKDDNMSLVLTQIEALTNAGIKYAEQYNITQIDVDNMKSYEEDVIARE